LVLPACGKKHVPAGPPVDASAVADTASSAQPSAEDDGCGYLGPDGKLVIARRFDSAAEFSSGLAAVRTGKKVGFIDPKGAYAIEPTFDEAKSFREDLAAACVNDKGWGFIDRKGAWVIAPNFAFADSFANGLAVVKIDPNEKDPCVVYPGKEVPPGSECESAQSFGEDEEEPGRYFLIDKTGSAIHRQGYQCITRMSEGLAAARRANKWGYLDRKGIEAIPPRFGHAKPFGEGLAAVWMPKRRRDEDYLGRLDGTWGFINRRGRFALLPRFHAWEVGVFSEGLIAMEGVPARMLLDSEAGRPCALAALASNGLSPEDFDHDNDTPTDCGAYLDKKGNVRLAAPYCFFDDAPMGYRSFREFSGGFAEVVMEEPMIVRPFTCAPALMGTVSMFIDRQGRFVPARGVLRGRSSDGLVPNCASDRPHKDQDRDTFVWE
jgi:hypothetical protein